MPPLVVEIATGCVLAIAAVVVCKLLTPYMHDIAPYSTGFVSVGLAAVLADHHRD